LSKVIAFSRPPLSKIIAHLRLRRIDGCPLLAIIETEISIS
jgi:hypothetical protein